jgi:para-aminobenzoate synthetase/4-amino-4-deoxychorismate lyase
VWCNIRADNAAWARFDDLGEGGRSFLLTEPVEAFETFEIDGVSATVSAAQRAAADGLWVAGYVAYEAAPAFDSALRVCEAAPALPLASFVAFKRRRIVDPPRRPSPMPAHAWTLDWDADQHAEAIGRVRALVAAGTTYQVNLTTRARTPVKTAEDLYPSLLWAQSCSYGALLAERTRTIVSASPELFFDLNGDRVLLRPMKGTVSRGRWPSEDASNAATLSTSLKERAENVMIVDLVRSDIGRIAEVGSVRVDTLCAVEAYPTVWQMTSTITASVPGDPDLVELFTALFPSGSVTGAPKVSAMKAIAELEGNARGVYCGAIGYIEPGRPVHARFSVAIRTAVVDHATEQATFGVGGGITWPSDPAAEWAELIAKTEVLSHPALHCGLVETMRCDPDLSIHNLERHLRRLASSASALGLPFESRVVSEALAAGARPGRIRLVLESDGTVDVSVSPLPPRQRAPVRLGLLRRAVFSGDRMLYHKVADRRRYDAWRSELPQVDDAILTNERDEVTETTGANVAIFLEGRWWTPPLSCGLLPGIERERLIAEDGLAERVVHAEELDGAQIALVSSLRGWRPATLVESGPPSSR